MSFLIVVLLGSLFYTGMIVDNQRKHTGKKIDRAVKKLKQHERNQEYLRKKRRIKRGR